MPMEDSKLRLRFHDLSLRLWPVHGQCCRDHDLRLWVYSPSNFWRSFWLGKMGSNSLPPIIFWVRTRNLTGASQIIFSQKETSSLAISTMGLDLTDIIIITAVGTSKLSLPTYVVLLCPFQVLLALSGPKSPRARPTSADLGGCYPSPSVLWCTLLSARFGQHGIKS